MVDGELQHTLALGPSFSTLSLTTLTLTLKLHYGYSAQVHPTVYLCSELAPFQQHRNRTCWDWTLIG